MFISLGVMWLENLRHVFSNYVLILLIVNLLDFFKCFFNFNCLPFMWLK